MRTGEGNGNNFRKGGRYLYADYTPLEQNIDFLSQIKDFSSLSNIIFQAHNDFEHLRSVLANAESLESQIVSVYLRTVLLSLILFQSGVQKLNFGTKEERYQTLV